MGDPLRESLKVPAFCPICERLMRGKESVRTWYNHAACSDCYIQWIEGREDRWRSGWRPTPEDVTRFVASLKRVSF